MRTFNLWKSFVVRCSSSSSLSSVSSSSNVHVSSRDLEDFRLRVWQWLKEEKGREQLPELTEEDHIRLEKLGQEAAAWKTTLAHLEANGVGRALGGMLHVEKDKQIVRDLLKHSVNKNSMHGLQLLYKKIAKPLGLGETQSDCYRLMMDLHVVTSETNPCVVRYSGQPLFFPPSVMEAVPAVVRLHEQGHDPDKRFREDLRDLAAYTIDAANATEIDDAVSLWVDPKGQEWALVHVADPTRLIDAHSPLERYAAQRGCSVFLPERHFPMLPQALASSVFSISPGKVTHALTFAARLCPTTGALLESRIFPSLLENVTKVSYNVADKLLASSSEAPRDLQILNQLAQVRRQWREKAGATLVQLLEPSVIVNSTSNSVKIVLNHEPSATRSLIEEMMIVAGQVAAEFSQRNGFPIPYRVQHANPAAGGPIGGGSGGGGGVFSSAQPPPLSNLVRSPPRGETIDRILTSVQWVAQHGPAFMDAVPRRHASIGLDAYSQVTSPIRRYPDMMAAMQIKAFLRGESLPFSSWDILQYRASYEVTTRQAETLQTQSIRFWILRHLESNAALRQQQRCIVLPKPGFSTVNNGSPKARSPERVLRGDVVPIFLLDLGLRATLKLRQDRAVGEEMLVSVEKVNSLLLEVDFVEKRQ